MDTEKIAIRCNIATSDPSVPLAMRVSLNGQILQEIAPVTDSIAFEHWVDDGEQAHELVFEMSGKTPQHTEMDDSGTMIKDAHLTISNFSVDGVEISNWDCAAYTHNFNGSADTITEQFYGYFGCNGLVSVKFSTPIYIWLLENL